MKKNLIALLVIVSYVLSALPIDSQEDFCSLSSVISTYNAAVVQSRVTAWAESYEASDCSEQVWVAVRQFADASDALTGLAAASSDPACSLDALLTSFTAAALSEQVPIWRDQYTMSSCGQNMADVAVLLGSAYTTLTSQYALVVNSVTLMGNFQTELGCPENWMPDCQNSSMTYDTQSNVWRAEFELPPGNYEYVVSVNHNREETYGESAHLDGAPISIELNQRTNIIFLYNQQTHWITDTSNRAIINVPGSFQDEIGCSGDWQPECLRTLLQDSDEDGIFTFVTTDIPAGDYEAKVAVGETWAENYGANGARDGANIPFEVPIDFAQVTFEFNTFSKLLTITVNSSITADTVEGGIEAAPSIPQPRIVVIAGTFQSELGCPGNWQPDCPATALILDTNSSVWRAELNLPPGNYEYKIAINGSWEENYGAGNVPYGPNIPLSLSQSQVVYFCYDHSSHRITHSFVAPDSTNGCR